MPTTTSLDQDRLFPAEPRTRELARELYAGVAEAPIISPHGHVDPTLLATDRPFADPTDLLITHDHYVTRLLVASGCQFDELGLDPSRPADARAVWRRLAEHWHRFAGTASAYWIRHELAELFGIDEELAPANADRTYDRIAVTLAEPAFTPRELFRRFRIDVLATTDDPLDDLAAHRTLAADPGFPGRVLPTFRPDAYLDPEADGFAGRIERLLAESGRSTDFVGYLAALAGRRAHFVEHGAVSADHGVLEPVAFDLDAAEAERLFADAVAGRLDSAGARRFRGHMLFQMARMSVDDGLVMTVHPGVRRNHHTETFRAYGPDRGHDIPVRTEYTESIRPLLERFGMEPGFHLVLFAIDETLYSRELAPLAGFYPSVYVGAPWWFLDAPDAILRYRSAVTETAGFYRTSGFIDDTRAFLSIPARHDASRRLDAAFLARLVAEGRVSLPTAHRIAADLVDAIPREVFKL
ncbi:glucuronate isomerase [Agromyces bracchium]|uniref:Uronate isomerase n=1 Tax=Agromyces bracchium TaxID=88376 RepID=A0A6I3M9M6_9MICO|nr:glucuronate isomerase [Agromyces bracchium]MTH70169.1 glucuronate isomerase [Agromyces bracchium]